MRATGKSQVAVKAIPWQTSIASLRRMARLGIEPRPPEYMPSALPLSYLALGDQVGLLIMSCVTDCISNNKYRDSHRPAYLYRKTSSHPSSTPRNLQHNQDKA